MPESLTMLKDFAPTDYAITTHGDFVDFGGIKVQDPERHHDHVVTIDHVVEPDGNVWIRVNGVPLEEVAERAGSYIR